MRLRDPYQHLFYGGFLILVAVSFAVVAFQGKGEKVQAATTITCSGSSGSPTAVDEASLASQDVTFTGSGWCALDAAVSATSVIVESGVTITHTSAVAVGVDITTSGNFTIQSGATIDVSGKGCVPGNNYILAPNGSNACVSTSAGYGSTTNQGAPGASHGGRGGMGAASATAPNLIYDSPTAPVLFGASGGSNGTATGGTGGGLVKIQVSGTFTHNGAIVADATSGIAGTSGRAGGGGSGGSINVVAPVVDGSTGTFVAKGGAGGSNTGSGGGGSGGRVSVVYNTGSFSFGSSKFDLAGGAAGGAGANPGPKGTVFVNDNAGTTGSTADDDVNIYEGFTYTDTDWNVNTWTVDSSATGQNCDPALATSATPSVTAGTIVFGGTLDCSPTATRIASFTWSAPSGFSTAASSSMAIKGSLTVTSSASSISIGAGSSVSTITTDATYGGITFSANSSFTLGDGSSVSNASSKNSDITFGIPAANDQTWTNVTVNGAPEGEFIVSNAMALTLAGTTVINSNVNWLSLTDLTVGTSASVNANGKGCVTTGNYIYVPNSSNVCGATVVGYANLTNAGAPGSSHGGAGGVNTGFAYTSNPVYGSASAPVLFGPSGGSTQTLTGGTGGGFVKIQATGTLTLNGSISADGDPGIAGTSGRAGGGGSGGSIYVVAPVVDGSTGTFSAKGGAGGANTGSGGGGGGGRIAIVHNTGSLTVDSGIDVAGGAAGGTGANAGTKGTVFVQDTAGTSGTSTDDDIYIYHGYTFADTDWNVNSWTADSSATNQYCDLTLATSATPSVTTAAGVVLGGDIDCGQSILSLSFSAGSSLSLATNKSISVNGALGLSATTTFSLGSGSSVSVTKANSDITFGIPAANDQTWTNVTINGSPQGDLIVSSAMALSLAGSTAINSNVRWLGLTDLIVGSSASVNADGMGCVTTGNYIFSPNGSNVCGSTSLGYTATTKYGASGATHGGVGGLGTDGTSASVTTNLIYDSASDPILYGASGGSAATVTGGNGGGLVQIQVSGTVTHNGLISANADPGIAGTSDRSGGGGAGGSINIVAPVFDGSTGTLAATGGDSGTNLWYAGGGGGGRIAIAHNTGSFVFGTGLDVSGGVGIHVGNPATADCLVLGSAIRSSVNASVYECTATGTPGTWSVIAPTDPAGWTCPAAGALKVSSTDNFIYGCTVTGTPGTWKVQAENGTKGTVFVNDNAGTTGSTADDDVNIYHGFTYADTDWNVNSWTVDSSATNQHCDPGLTITATPSVTAASAIAFQGAFNCSPTGTRIASFAWSAPSGFSTAASSSMAVKGPLSVASSAGAVSIGSNSSISTTTTIADYGGITLSANTAFTLGNGSTITNSSAKNSNITFGIPAGDDQTWTDVTIDGSAEGDLIISNAMALALAGSTAVNSNVSWLSLTDLTIGSSASINANGKGCVTTGNYIYAPNSSNVCIGTSAGYVTTSNQGSHGATHGGAGGLGTGVLYASNSLYGSDTAPVLYGASGGGATVVVGGTGGGLVRIQATGTLTLNGSISADGEAGVAGTNGRSSGGGSGGSVNVWAGTLAGSTGSFSAQGGEGGSNAALSYGGGGSGGRMAIRGLDSSSYMSGLTDSGAVPGGASGGGTAQAGATGTLSIVYPPASTQFPTGNGTTDFTSEPDLTAVSNMKLAKSIGSIQWTSPVNAVAQDYDSNVRIASGYVSVNAPSLHANVDAPAHVEIGVNSCTDLVLYYATGFRSSVSEIIANGQVCNAGTTPACANITCDALTASFDVPHFDSYGGEGAMAFGGSSVPTSSTIQNATPAFDIAPDDSSTSISPTNAGGDVTFSATASDPNGEDWYLAICQTNSIAPGNDAAPTCPGGSWGVSAVASSGVGTTATYATTAGNAESNPWYAFACDKVVGGGMCSAMSNAASPFEVNHRPSYSAYSATDATGGTIEPGDTVKFSATTTDTDAGDTVALYVCPSGNTFNGSGCSGTEICHVVATTPGAVSCSSATLAPIPTAHGSINVEIFVVDTHSFVGNDASTQSYTVTDVAPTITSSNQYSTTNITLSAGTSTAKSYTVVVSDNNGGSDLVSTTAALYDSAAISLASGTCSASDTNCYSGVSCTPGSPSGVNITYTCDFTVWFNANASSSWKMHANPADGQGAVTNLPDSNAVTVGALQAISIPEVAIAYGALTLGATSSGVAITLQNVGNQVLDMLVQGSDMSRTGGGATIPLAQQKWHNSTLDFVFGQGNTMVASAAGATTKATGCADRNMAVRAAHASGVGSDENLYWKLQMPSAQMAGSYAGTNTFAAAGSTQCTDGE